MDLRGRLPLVDGEALIAVISAHADAARSAIDRLDLHTVPDSLAQRRADALVTIINRHQQGQLAPDHGGDRPRITITMRLDDLRQGLRGATLTGTCQTVSPGEARRLACDADLIPAVLGSESAILDVGRQKRLFCGELRRALVERDPGCVFPSCDRLRGTAKPTTSSRGGPAAPPASATGCCCVRTTTAPWNPIRTRHRAADGRSVSTRSTARVPPTDSGGHDPQTPTSSPLRRTRPALRLRSESWMVIDREHAGDGLRA